MSKRLRNLVMKVAVIGMSIYIIFTSIIPTITTKSEAQIQTYSITQEVEREINSRADIDISKQILKTKLEKADVMVKTINSEVEYILKTIDGTHTVSHSKSPEDNIADWLIDSAIDVTLRYRAIVSIPSNKIANTIDKSGAVLIDYDIGDIQVKAVEIIQYNVTQDKKLLGKKYTNEEVISLIELGQEDIRSQINSNIKMKYDAGRVLESHMKDLAKQLQVSAVGFNNQYIESTSKYKYIDNGNVTYGHPNKHRTENIEYIVIHSTANKNVDAEAHAQWLNNDKNSNAANYYVDYDSIQNTLDLNMYPYHVGNNYNNKSIGIEICEFDDMTEQLQTIDNTRDLIDMLQDRFPEAEVVYHKELSSYDKQCPSLIYGNNPPFTEEGLSKMLGLY